MDASRTLKTSNQKGFAFVYLVFILAGMLAIAALVVDLGYMYVKKAKLQNAADAGALAGAGRIKIPDVFANISARSSAKHFAKLNETALNLNLNDASNSTNGDIVLGVFNPDSNPKFTAVPIQGTYSSINAVKVVTRRNEDAGDGINASQKIDLFFSKILGVDKLGAKASAVAWRPPRATTYFIIGNNVCNPAPPPPPNAIYPFELSMGVNNMGWTSLLDPSTTAVEVKDVFFCPVDNIPNDEVCGLALKTTGGTASTVFESVETDFNDPNYDRNNKTFIGSNVDTWEVIVPVAGSIGGTPVTNPAAQNSDIPIWGYAKLIIISACGTPGAGNPCPGGRSFPGTCPPALKNKIRVKSIECVPCASRWSMIGAKPVLAE